MSKLPVSPNGLAVVPSFVQSPSKRIASPASPLIRSALSGSTAPPPDMSRSACASSTSVLAFVPPRSIFSMLANLSLAVPERSIDAPSASRFTMSIPDPPSAASGRTPITIVSSPASPLKESTPPPPISVSLPSPPRRTSLPCPPQSVSSPLPPHSVSLPTPPKSLSSPSRPFSLSLPDPPLSTSLPGPPSRRSAPASPTRMSFPRPPKTESWPPVPVSFSFSRVPLEIAMATLHKKRAAAANSGHTAAAGNFRNSQSKQFRANSCVQYPDEFGCSDQY